MSDIVNRLMSLHDIASTGYSIFEEAATEIEYLRIRFADLERELERARSTIVIVSSKD